MHQRGPRHHQAGDHDPARLEPAITGDDDRNEHPFVDPEPTEPFRDDHIDTFRQLDVLDVAVDHLDDLRGRDLPGDRLGPAHRRVQHRGVGPGRLHRQRRGDVRALCHCGGAGDDQRRLADRHAVG